MTIRTLLWCAVSTKQQLHDNESLPEQQANMLAKAEQLDLHVVDTLLVPGHSRRYIDIHECAADMLNSTPPVTAYRDLLLHWERKDFDVLMCRDGSRFARTQSLHAYVVERTIENGARIYSIADGWVDKTNFRMMIAMGGYSASREIDEFVRRSLAGRDTRAKQFLFTSGPVPATHKRIIDNETGKTIRIEPRPEAIEEMVRVAQLLKEGVSFAKMELAMYARFGYGAPHHVNHYYTVLFSPRTWGHYVRGITSQAPWGLWRIEPGHAIPSGVRIHYHVMPPVLPVEYHAAVIAETKRRKVMRGKHTPKTQYWTQGLLCCALCKSPITHQKRPQTLYLLCRRNQYAGHDSCENRTSSRIEDVKHFVTELLTLYQTRGYVPSLQSDMPLSIQPDTAPLQIEALTKQIKALLVERAKFPDIASDTDGLLNEYSNQRKTLQLQLQRYEAKQVARDVPLHFPTTTIDAFWQQTPTQINQWLHQFLAGHKIAIHGKEIGIISTTSI